MKGVEHDLKGPISLGKIAKNLGAHCFITSLPGDNSQRESKYILGKKKKIASQPLALNPKDEEGEVTVDTLLLKGAAFLKLQNCNQYQWQ